jgi:hypothetical protein
VSPAVIVTMLVLMLPLQPPAAGAAEPAAACQPLQLVPPGTSVHNPAGSRWNRVVLLAAPRIASGDAESVSHAIRQRVSQFTLALLATGRQPVPRVKDGTSWQNWVSDTQCPWTVG